MFKKLLGKSPTSKVDVGMAVVMAVSGIFSAITTYKDYKSEQQQKENEQ